MLDKLHRRASEYGDDLPSSAPGKRSLTQSLAGRPQVVFRVESAEAATALGEAFGARDRNGVAAGADVAVDRAAGSSGSPLPEDLRGTFESSLGTDLSAVRIHTGGESAEASSAVGARAYTTGQDIHFGAGQYDPSSAFGVHLLAHEVAHTVQQQGTAPVRQNKLEVSAPQDSAEVEADRAADAMVAGMGAKVSTQSVAVVRLFDDYSTDADLKQLPPGPKYTQAGNEFGGIASAMEQSMLGGDVALPSPQGTFTGSMDNLTACRNNAESSNVYYSHHTPSKYNPLEAGNFNAELAKSAVADAQWAITMIGNVRIAGTATASWINLLNGSNKSWSDLVAQAKAMDIEVGNKVKKDSFTGEVSKGDQTISKDDVAGEANTMAAIAKKHGIKAPDTSSYKTAQSAYNLARNKLVPEQRTILTATIPNNISAITAKKKESEAEKEKWETIKTAAQTFEKGLTVAFAAGEFAAAEGSIGIDKESGELAQPKGIEPKAGVEKGSGFLSKAIDMRINNIAAQIATYQVNLKNYTDVQEAQNLKSAVERYKNILVELRDLAITVETKQVAMEKAFQEFGKSLDLAMQKDMKTAKPGSANQHAAGLFTKIRSANTTTQAAIDGMSSGGAGDVPTLINDLVTSAAGRGANQTDAAGGLAGRSDGRSAVFAIEKGRWGKAGSAIGKISAALTRRQAETSALEASFMAEFANASGGTDSLK